VARPIPRLAPVINATRLTIYVPGVVLLKNQS
jgi:hypothetical protein